MNRKFTLQWHVTAKCDQHCKHCYMYDEPTYESELKDELKFEDCIKIIDDFDKTIKKWKMRGRIDFTGGDPLLRRDFFDILEYANKKNIWIEILGNPYHINQEIVEKLKEFGVKYYQISIDGMEKTHDFLRRPGSFKESLKALKILKEAGIKTRVMFTLNKQNADDLINVINLTAKEEIDVFAFARMVPTGSAKFMKNELFTPTEYRKLLLKVFKEFKKLEEIGVKTKFSRKDHLWKLLYKELGLKYRNINFGVSDKLKLTYSGCSVGVNGLTILANGLAYACRRFPSPIGKLPEQKIEDIFMKSDKLNEYRNVSKFEKCSKCDLLQFCRGCPAVAFGTTGSFFGCDPQCWKVL